MRRIIGILSLLAIGVTAAQAGDYSGMVKPYYHSAGLYLDASAANSANKPACATRSLLRLQETDLNDPVFKAKFAILLSSWIAGAPVQLGGTGTCTAEGDEIIFLVAPK
jgi:hypothetical protein